MISASLRLAEIMNLSLFSAAKPPKKERGYFLVVTKWLFFQRSIMKKQAFFRRKPNPQQALIIRKLYHPFRKLLTSRHLQP